MELKDNIAYIIYFGVFVMTFFIVVIILFVVVYQRKRLEKENEYNSSLKEKEVQLLKIHIETQELEREKIARNIHDEIGPLVSALKLHLSLHEIALTKGQLTKQDLVEERVFVDEIMRNIRLTSQDLSPNYLLRDGLENALQNYLHSLSTIETTFLESNESVDIPDKIGINIYRVVLELCNNIVKHTTATRLELKLEITSDQIIVKLEHDGIGMDNTDFLNYVEKSNGIGLRSLKARTTLLNSSLNFSKGETSQVIFITPFANEKKN